MPGGRNLAVAVRAILTGEPGLGPGFLAPKASVFPVRRLPRVVRVTLARALLERQQRESALGGLVHLGDLEQLQGAAAVAGKRLQLLEGAVSLEGLGAAVVRAHEKGAEHVGHGET